MDANHLKHMCPTMFDGIIRPDRPTGAKELDELLTQEQDQRYTDNAQSVQVIRGLNKERSALQTAVDELKKEAEIAEMLRQKEIEMSDRQQKEKDDEILRLNKVIKEADDEEEETPLVILDMMDRTATAEDASRALKVEIECLKDYWEAKYERDMENAKDDGILEGREEMEDECEREIDEAVDSGRELEREEADAHWNDWLNEEFGDELYPLEDGPEPEEFVKKVKATAKSEKKFEALEQFIENTRGWGDFVADIPDYWKDQLMSAGYSAEDFE